MTGTSTARRFALVGVLALLVSLLPLAGANATDGGDQPHALDQPDGDNSRLSINWSQTAYPDTAVAADAGPTEALIGRDDLFADNLASGVLQGQGDNGTPLLLTPSDALDADVADELERLGVTDVTILGGTDAISQDVEDDLDATYNVTRLSGETRIETAIDVADEVTSDTAILARGFAADDPTQAFADSIAAGAWAAEAGYPVLFTQTEVLTGNTATALADYDNVIIVGGTQAVSADVETEVEDIVGTGNVRRVSGATRFDTAVEIAQERGINSSADADLTVLVDGQGSDAWADGFAAANVAGNNGYPIVLANSADDNLPQATADFLDGTASAFANHLADGNYVLICGGSVPDDQCAEAAGLLGVADEDIIALEDAGFVAGPDGGNVQGSITLDNTTTSQGGTISGTVADPGTVQSLSASGCGVSNQNLEVGGDGAFSLTIPASQAAGSCQLSFIVSRTNGDSETATFTITITAGAQGVTNAPDLVSASANTTTGVVTYTFDEAATGSTPSPANFHIYSSDGTQFTPTTVSATGSTVLAQYTTTEVNQSTTATVEDNAVTDASGAQSAIFAVPLQNVTFAAGITDGPDLLSVTNLQSQLGSIQASFTFDENVDTAGTVNPARFYLIATDGSLYQGQAAPAPTISANNRTVTVSFNTGASTVPISQIARGVVDGDGSAALANRAVIDTASMPNGNVVSSADVNNAGNTETPDLVSATVSGTDQVTFVFDEPVDPGAPVGTYAPVAGSFGIYNNAGMQSFGTTAQRSPTDATRVIVTYAAGAVGNAVGAFVDDCGAPAAGPPECPAGPVAFTTVNANGRAVVDNDDTFANRIDEVGLQQLAFQGGRTQKPDLVKVEITVDAFGDNKVVYTFDQALPAGYTPIPADFVLYDDAATLFNPAGNGTLNSARTTVTFSNQGTSANGFTNSQATAAVIGSVNDSVAGNPVVGSGPAPAPPTFPEGGAPVQRPAS